MDPTIDMLGVSQMIGRVSKLIEFHFNCALYTTSGGYHAMDGLLYVEILQQSGV